MAARFTPLWDAFLPWGRASNFKGSAELFLSYQGTSWHLCALEGPQPPPSEPQEGAGGSRAPAGRVSVVDSMWWTERGPGGQEALIPTPKPAWGTGGQVHQQAAWLPSRCPFSPVGRSRGSRRGPVCPAQFRVYWEAHIVRKTPPPPTPTPKQGSPSQPRSLSVLKGQRTGMMWRVQPGASSDTSPAGPRHRVPTGSLRARLRDAAPAKGFSVSFGSGVLYPWCVPGLKL